MIQSTATATTKNFFTVTLQNQRSHEFSDNVIIVFFCLYFDCYLQQYFKIYLQKIHSF